MSPTTVTIIGERLLRKSPINRPNFARFPMSGQARDRVNAP
jgi:hypothetical protein